VMPLMASVSLRARCGLALSAVLLLAAGAGSGRSQAQRLESREGRGAPMVAALSRLSPAEGRQYLQAQQAFERQRSSQRLAQLDQTQRCLAQAGDQPALQGCWRALFRDGQQLRHQEKDQQAQLAQRFGLPLPLRPAGATPAGR
jgi:hypothetical protein